MKMCCLHLARHSYLYGGFVILTHMPFTAIPLGLPRRWLINSGTAEQGVKESIQMQDVAHCEHAGQEDYLIIHGKWDAFETTISLV